MSLNTFLSYCFYHDIILNIKPIDLYIVICIVNVYMYCDKMFFCRIALPYLKGSLNSSPVASLRSPPWNHLFCDLKVPKAERQIKKTVLDKYINK